MPTFIKTGFWEKAKKGYKDWLNLDQLIQSISPSFDQTLNTIDQVTFLTVTATSNGGGINYEIGDDAFLGDINISNTVQLRGVQTPSKGMLKFGTNIDAPVIGNRGGATLLNIAKSNGTAVIPVYNDNAAALSAGLLIGDLYRTGDTLKIVH